MKVKCITVFVLFFLVGEASAQLENIPLVTVTGESVVKVKPDYALISVIAKKDFSSGQLATLSSVSLFQSDDNRINTITSDVEVFATTPVYERSQNTNTFSKNYVLQVNDLSRLSKVVIDLLRRGLLIETIDYRLTKLEEYKNEARKLAIQNAKHKAMILASASGQKIGKTHLILERELNNENWYSETLGEKTLEIYTENYIFNIGYISIPCKVDVSFDLLK
jgi:uncharacterized protein YggE